MMNNWRSAGFGAALGFMALTSSAMAIDGAAGDYAYFGDGVKLLLFHGQHQSTSSLHVDGVGDVPDSKLGRSFGLLRGVSYQGIGGMKTSFQFILPVAHFKYARIGGAELATSGSLGDLTLGATICPLASNEPAGTTFGATLFVTAPAGNYQLELLPVSWTRR